jgi:FkbM family methyltransferase
MKYSKGRVLLKCRQIAAFFRSSKTPLTLTADAIRIKRRPFVAINRDGVKLRLAPSSGESFTFYENLIRRDHLSGGIRLGPGDTVVDIGANIGSFTVLAASIVGPPGRVVALEPVGDTFARLKENISINGLSNVTCRQAAVDSPVGTLEIRMSAKSALCSAHIDGFEADTGTVESVPSTTLEQIYCDEKLDRINLLKVDCEGSEHEIFGTLPPSVARQIDQIAMEAHAVAGGPSSNSRRISSPWGFRVHWGPTHGVAFNTATRP